jgi:hypothetical protein
MHAQTFFSFLLVGGAGPFLWRFSTFINAMAKIASRKEEKGLRWYVLLCFSPSVLIKKSQSDSKAVALAVNLEAATRFHRMACIQIDAIRRGFHRNICKVFVVPYPAAGMRLW